MTTTTDNFVNTEERVDDGAVAAAAMTLLSDDRSKEAVPRRLMPWIGGLRNPHLVPMVVVNEEGYLVPLLTAGDLLRGCKFYWQQAED